MTPTDNQFVHLHLNRSEQKLFYAMNKSVQKHCVEVASHIIKEKNISSSEQWEKSPELEILVKAALLHDIGKLEGTFNIIDRVAYVLMKKISPYILEKIAERTTHKKKFLYRFRNALFVNLKHADIGGELAAKAGLDEEVVHYITNHHNTGMAVNNENLKLLMDADELC